jgi:hypothetical protein
LNDFKKNKASKAKSSRREIRRDEEEVDAEKETSETKLGARSSENEKRTSSFAADKARLVT